MAIADPTRWIIALLACVRLLVAHCGSSEFLDLTEEVFDQMAPFVHLEVAIDGVLSTRFGRNDGDGAPGG